MAATTLTPAEQVLAAARSTRSAMTDLEIEQLLQAVQWAQLHPGEDRAEIATWAMRPLELAGDGAPTVDESAVAEFALAVGMKHEPGARLIGEAIELCHRLPRLWARVMAGEVQVWKARKVADSTMSLPLDAANHVDRSLAWVAHRCSFAEIERQVENARAEYDPAETERLRQKAAEDRHLTLYFQALTATGRVPVEGTLDLADALALDKTLTARAATLDPELPLDVRRSMAAGMLGTDGGPERQVVIYTHTRPDAAMVEVENTRSVVTPDQVKEWCSLAGTRVMVRPVLDLAEELSTDAYEATPLMREQVYARYPTCVFLHCEHPSRGCDTDHRIPWPLGPTPSWNLYPLCRGHHRLKTTGGWTYQPLGPDTIEWTSPMRIRYLRHTH